jgi:hypothetical protein
MVFDPKQFVASLARQGGNVLEGAWVGGDQVEDLPGFQAAEHEACLVYR